MAALLLSSPVRAESESCVECHLHRSFVEDFGRAEVKTLAGLHGREFKAEETNSACEKCHGGTEGRDKPPASEACLRCHTRGKAAQGDPSMVFHAEKDHWPMKKVTCAECHKGHVKGDSEIKFLTADAIMVCSRCHEKSFDQRKAL